MTTQYDGFWLPAKLRDGIITDKTPWTVQFRVAGQLATEQDPLAVGARWPRLTRQEWEFVHHYLGEHRSLIGPDFIIRLQTALSTLFQSYQSGDTPIPQEIVDSFTTYTGYSQQMVLWMMSFFDHNPFSALHQMLRATLPASSKKEYVSLPQLGGPEGWIRFYPQGAPISLAKFLKTRSGPLAHKTNPPQSILGYASGNVLGTAFIISLLAQLSGLAGGNLNPNQTRTPAILVKNSRQEPLFVPFLFSAIEAIDPELLSSVAVMIWDYEDTELQEMLVSRSELVLAAAADHTIDQIGKLIRNANPSARFHAHGHKTSFTTIGKEYLAKTSGRPTESDLFNRVSMLAAFDSILWDQNGCLSSRIHFIEQASPDEYSPLEYGIKLAEKMRTFSQKIPRGNIPLSRIHNRFDQFNALTLSPDVDLCSNYADDFIVVVDNRQWDQQQFRSIINSCMERTVVIRPVASIQEVPEIYLPQLPSKNLQTMYVAIDGPSHPNWSTEFSLFVERVGKRGVTSIRTIGQSAFPQLAYSWDGFIPHSLSLEFPAGYFTTVEFDHTYKKIQQVWRWLAKQIG